MKTPGEDQPLLEERQRDCVSMHYSSVPEKQTNTPNERSYRLVMTVLYTALAELQENSAKLGVLLVQTQ